MPCQNITHLRVSALPRRHRCGLRKEAQAAGFETIDSCLVEDVRRRKWLKRSREQCNLSDLGRRAPVKLYKELGKCAKRGTISKSAASSRRMRRTRWHLTAWLACLYRTEPTRSWRGGRNPLFVNIIPRSASWIVPGDLLCDVDANKLLEQLRIDLTRKGGVPEDGWAFFGLHGEYFEQTDQWHIHVHGLVAGEMIDRCKALRKRKKYRSLRDGRSPAPERGATPIEFTQEAPKDLWRQTAYRFQSFWPVGGKERRNRIPEPRHSQWLMWMDRYQPSDLCLLIGLRVKKGQLVRTGKAYVNG